MQVNHILNHNIATSTNGFWVGTHTGMVKMRADMKSDIHLLNIEDCEFRYDIMYICKNSTLLTPMAEFVETIRQEAEILIKTDQSCAPA